MPKHLLNLRALAEASVDDYELLRFDGREAISEPFDYHLELISAQTPDLKTWIGKIAEWDVTQVSGYSRVFAGRIYAARRVESNDIPRILLRVRPAYFALSYGHATHFIQDKNSVTIFNAMTSDVTGLVKSVNVSPAPPVRGYSVRYDESEIDYLARLLAQDGIMYFFLHDTNAGNFHHKMIVTSAASDYVDIDCDEIEFLPSATDNVISTLAHEFRAGATASKHASFNVNKLDAPWQQGGSSTASWSSVYAHEYETIGYEAVESGDLKGRAKAEDDYLAQSAETIDGSSDQPMFLAGGRVTINGADTLSLRRVVLTSVTHSAYDPWMIQGSGGGKYSNSFTAMDATKVFRPSVGTPDRQAPGPLLGMVEADGAAAGETKIDEQARIPVTIAHARDYSGAGLPKTVWLPVQQQWAHSTHGAQFFPRVGSRVIIDFFYGNPDLPFVSGMVYTPNLKYPFDPASKATQTGWRSVSDKNGSITQEFHFEDKPGSEEIYLYTGRDYRRMIDHDDFGTVKHDQTLEVQHDQKLTVKNDRTVTINGIQKTDITKTRTITITDKSLVESMKEIQLKVGPSTITMNMQGITIKAPKIQIQADISLDMSGGAMASLKAPKTDVNADAMLTLKGGIVMIN